jgi:hypothetical protein
MTHDFSYPRYLPSSDYVPLCTIISSHLRVNIPLITILPIYLYLFLFLGGDFCLFLFERFLCGERI